MNCVTNVCILFEGKWVVGDIALPRMEKLVLYGVLELDDDNGARDFELRCKYIIILGGRLIIGWPNKPFLANALVILEGNKQTDYYEQDSGPTIGSKVLGKYEFVISGSPAPEWGKCIDIELAGFILSIEFGEMIIHVII